MRSWLGRVFHNSYTRRGRRIVLRGWSVKLQFQGRRRTLSLRASTRAGAAAEAEAIHRTLVTEGWEAVCRQRGSRRGGPSLDTDLQLTRREREVLSLLSGGCTDKEIAHALAISAWTVHEHVKRIFEKLRVHSRVGAAMAFLRAGQGGRMPPARRDL